MHDGDTMEHQTEFGKQPSTFSFRAASKVTCSNIGLMNSNCPLVLQWNMCTRHKGITVLFLILVRNGTSLACQTEHTQQQKMLVETFIRNGTIELLQRLGWCSVCWQELNRAFDCNDNNWRTMVHFHLLVLAA